jgi:hypothetical protein
VRSRVQVPLRAQLLKSISVIFKKEIENGEGKI